MRCCSYRSLRCAATRVTGRRPDFTAAAPPTEAEALYERCAAMLREAGLSVETGVFGAHMEIDTACDGPVTILLNSKKLY